MRHGSKNTSSFDLRVKMLILPQYKLKLDIGEYIAFWIKFLAHFKSKWLILKSKHQIQVCSWKPHWFQIKILPLLTLKWHILTDDHSYTMLLAGGTPLNNPLIDFCALFSKK